MNMLTVKGAAQKAGVSSTTMRRWIKDGIVQYARPRKRGMILISEEALLKVLEPR